MPQPIKDILEEINSTPCLRQEKEVTDKDDAVIVCHASELADAAAFYKAKLRRLPPLYVVGAVSAPVPQGIVQHPAEDLPAATEPHVFFKPAKAPRLSQLRKIAEFLQRTGFERYTVESSSSAQFWGRQKRVFSPDDMLKIRLISNILSDEQSKRAFLAAVKARQEGWAGYIPISSYPQYFHPDIQPMSGDCVCEGGIDDGASTQALAATVGPDGHIHAFEPTPASYEQCVARLSRYQQITLVNKALWHSDGTMPFDPSPNATGAARIKEGAVSVCQCASVDGYFQNQRLNLIKLDIEGAERQALMGAANSLRLHKPKLCLCIYHNAGRDLVDVPWHILHSGAEYTRFHVGHHYYWLNETVLYAA